MRVARKIFTRATAIFFFFFFFFFSVFFYFFLFFFFFYFFFFFFYRFPGDIFFFSLVSFAFFVFFVFTCLSQKSLGKSSFHSSSANDSKFITYCLPFFLNHVFFVPSFIIFCFFYFSIYSILHILLQFTPIYTNMLLQHCVKGVRIRSYSSPYFPACGLNTERETPYLSVFSPNAGKCEPE